MTNWKTYRIIDKADTSEVRNYVDFDVVALDGVVVFSDKTRDVRKVGSSAVVPRNNNSNLINQNQQGTAIQMLNRAIDSDPRNKYTASMEAKENNYGSGGEPRKVSKEEFANWIAEGKGEKNIKTPPKERIIYGASGDIDSITYFTEIKSKDEEIQNQEKSQTKTSPNPDKKDQTTQEKTNQQDFSQKSDNKESAEKKDKLAANQQSSLQDKDNNHQNIYYGVGVVSLVLLVISVAVVRQAKGYFGSKRKLFKTAKEQVMNAQVDAFAGRKQRKRFFRTIIRNGYQSAPTLPELNQQGSKSVVIKGHPVKPDKKFASPLVSQLINKVMKNGEKRKATRIVYQAAQLIEKNTSSPFLTILEGALVNIKPVIEMKSRKIVEGAQAKKTTSPMYEKLAEEISNDYNKSGEAVKKKETLYKEAESGGREEKIIENIKSELKKKGWEDYIHELKVVSDNQKKNILKGYIISHCHLTPELTRFFYKIPGITGFLNHQRGDNKLPDFVSQEVIKIKITEGTFVNREGRITHFDKKKQKVKIVIESSGWEISDVPINKYIGIGGKEESFLQKFVVKKSGEEKSGNYFELCGNCNDEYKKFLSTQLKEETIKELKEQEIIYCETLKELDWIETVLPKALPYKEKRTNTMLIHQSAQIKYDNEGFIIHDYRKMNGTLLNKDFSTLNQKNKKVLQELKARGHKICIATGRNYLSALPFYREIGLDTFLITYNGAYINHPLKNEVLANISIANSVVRAILAEEIIKKNLLNFMADSVDRQSISTSDDIYYQEVFFNGNPYIKGDVLQHLGNRDCLQLVLEFSNEERKINQIISTLRKKYKSSITFYCGEKLKAEREGEKVLVPDPTKLIIKIRNYNANKGEAAKLVAGYYNIPLSNTIAFGNDINDIEMMNKVGIGVAVSNSLNNLKAYVHDITEFDSHSGGVAKYLTDYFGREGEENEETLEGELIINDFPELGLIMLKNVRIVNLEIRNCPKFHFLEFVNYKIEKLSISNCEKITSIGFLVLRVSDKITRLDLNNLPKLTSLDCSKIELSSLNLTQIFNLERLICSESKLTTLNLTDLPNLRFLKHSGKKFKFLDISNNPKLEYLTLMDLSEKLKNKEKRTEKALSQIRKIISDIYQELITDNPNLEKIKKELLIIQIEEKEKKLASLKTLTENNIAFTRHQFDKAGAKLSYEEMESFGSICQEQINLNKLKGEMKRLVVGEWSQYHSSCPCLAVGEEMEAKCKKIISLLPRTQCPNPVFDEVGAGFCEEHDNEEISNIEKKHDQLLEEIHETGVSADFYQIIAKIYGRILVNKEFYIKEKIEKKIGFNKKAAFMKFRTQNATAIDACSLDEKEKKDITELDNKYHNYENFTLAELEKVKDDLSEAIKNKRAEKELADLLSRANNCSDNDLWSFIQELEKFISAPVSPYQKNAYSVHQNEVDATLNRLRKAEDLSLATDDPFANFPEDIKKEKSQAAIANQEKAAYQHILTKFKEAVKKELGAEQQNNEYQEIDNSQDFEAVKLTRKNIKQRRQNPDSPTPHSPNDNPPRIPPPDQPEPEKKKKDPKPKNPKNNPNHSTNLTTQIVITTATIIVGILGNKRQMTQILSTKEGLLIPVTPIWIGDNVISQVKTEDKEGYNACQIAFGDCVEKKLSKPKQGHLKKNNVPLKKYLREIRDMSGFAVGSLVDLSHFQVGDRVKITSNSRGKGTAGVHERYGSKVVEGHGAS
ncbi:10171_t:CDS:10 [Gigaspora margarita]|uniref:10171_t:CDS:1 n=1 Tax=Gigaspora margarita TaxID=4874 RepID=A0ABM8W2A1_GIGMA|nr:10171_t:CDS:10 [Gigaspora margarita]